MVSILRKWRVLLWLGLGLAGMLGVYALAGFFLLPWLIQTQGWPLLSAKLGGQFQAEATAFDPFGMALSVSGFSLRGADGGGLASVGEIALDVDVAASLKTNTLVASGKLVRPALDIRLDKTGKPNIAFLLPSTQKKAEPPPAFPFLLTAFAIEQGRLLFEDQSLGKGFKQVLSPLRLSLVNLGLGTQAHFELDAHAESQEQLAIEGNLALSPFAVAGDMKLEQIHLAPLAAWLVADLPYAVDSGSLSATLRYRYAKDTELELFDAEAEAKALGLTQDGQAFLDAASINIQGLGFNAKTARLELQALRLGGFGLQAPVPLKIASANAQHLGFQTKKAQLDIKTLALEELGLDGPAPATIASVNAQGFSFQGKANQLGLQSLAADTLKLSQGGTPLAAIGHLAADGFNAQLGHDTLALDSLKLDHIDLKIPSPVLDKEGNPRPSGVDALAVENVTVDMAKPSLAIGGIQGTGAKLAAWLDKDGSPGLSGMPKPNAPAGGETDTQPQASPPKPVKAAATLAPQPPRWQVKLDRVELNDNTLVLRDFGFDPPVAMRLSNLNLLVKDFDSTADRPFWLGLNTGLSMDGRVALEGQIKLSPLAASIKLYVDDLSLPAFQPYLDQAVRIRLVKGTLNLNADIDYAEALKPRLRWVGDVAVANFASEDKREGRDFANWKNLRLNGLVFEDIPQRLSIREVILSEPYLRAFIDADKKFNLVENLSPPATAQPASKAEKPAPSAPSTPAKPMSVVIGGVNIRDGEADFTDMTIKPTNFAAHIHELNGSIRSLSSRQDAKSDLLLEGRLGKGSAVKIFGKINPFSIQAFTDVVMDFKGVNLTTLSPYAAKFAGYRIEKGKLDMDLRYKLDNGQLTAENQFVLDHLQLGERVESRDATDLPVSLAISLLKDADGKIDIDLPVSGDLNNPDVSIRDLLAGAATSMLTKLVTSPFTLLGSLADSDDEDLQSVAFAPGVATLTGPEKDQLAAVSKALQARPGLNLDIKGAADLAKDGPILAEADLTRQLKNAKLIELGRKKGKPAEWDEMTLSDEDYRRLLTNLYRWKNPTAPELQGLKSGMALDGEALENAKRKLLAGWNVSEVDLRSLAQARGEAIRNYLVKDLGLSDQRIYLLDVSLGGNEGKDIKARLSLSGS